MANKYVYRSKLSENKFRAILRLFCIDIEASKVAQITNISRNTVNKIYDRVRERIAEHCESVSPIRWGEIELDESYFGAKRVRGIRGRGAKGKIPVFGILNRYGQVYTQLLPNFKSNNILPLIEQRADKSAVIYTDGYRIYDKLQELGYNHYRVNHGDNQFADGRNHINGIENFWGLCKVRLARYRGIHRHKYYYHLKECEFRYNNRGDDIYRLLLKILRKKPIKIHQNHSKTIKDNQSDYVPKNTPLPLPSNFNNNKKNSKMKIARITGKTAEENLRVFKPIKKIAVVAKFENFTETDKLKVDNFRMRVRLVDGRKGDSIDILPETEISVLSEIASKYEGFQRRPLHNAGKYNGVGTFTIPIGADVDGLLHAIDLSNDKYLDIDLLGLATTGVTYEVYGIEGHKVSSHTRKYSKYYLSSGELEKTFSTGENEVLALPLHSLREVQLYAKNGGSSPVYTKDELRVEEDSANDVNFIRNDKNFNLMITAEGTTMQPSYSGGAPVGSQQFVGGGVPVISFGAGNLVLIPLVDFTRFDIRRDEDSQNYQFLMIDTVPTK